MSYSYLPLAKRVLVESDPDYLPDDHNDPASMKSPPPSDSPPSKGAKNIRRERLKGIDKNNFPTTKGAVITEELAHYKSRDAVRELDWRINRMGRWRRRQLNDTEKLVAGFIQNPGNLVFMTQILHRGRLLIEHVQIVNSTKWRGLARESINPARQTDAEIQEGAASLEDSVAQDRSPIQDPPEVSIPWGESNSSLSFLDSSSISKSRLEEATHLFFSIQEEIDDI
ncbi:hypothetical protein BJX70DRAFT_400700 [Aspergillus crustosus]